MGPRLTEMESAMSEAKKTAKGRRDFLKVLGFGSIAGAAAVVAVLPPAEQADAAPSDDASSGYRETEHVRKFYELSRF